MNVYEQKLQAKAERYEARARKLNQLSDVLYKRARQDMDLIPMGQPILVGHHSERGHRNHLKRIDRAMGNSFKMQEKADYYREKAKTIGSGGISVLDPDAVLKLHEKLLRLETNHKNMVKMNKELRKIKDKEEQKAYLIGEGFSEASASRRVYPTYSFQRVGFQGWQLSNSSANIKQVKDRIASLERVQKMEAQNVQYEGFKIDYEEMRVNFEFDGKPSEEVRKKVKSYGFKWSPTRGVWTRMLTGNAIYQAKELAAKLK